MRTATALLISILLLIIPASCSTARKATAKQETKQETAATVEQTTTGHETGSAYFDQATLEQILQNYNVTVDFERWDFDTGQEGTPTDSTAAAQTGQQWRKSDKPPDELRPKSLTKGTVNITAEGSQTRATISNAGAQVNKTDSTTTAANVEKKETAKSETKDEKKESSTPTNVIIFFVVVAGLLIWRITDRSKS